MTHSESITKIAAAMVSAQGNMEPARKNSTNPAFRSKYADLAAVVEAVTPALQGARIAVVQSARGGEDGSVIVESMLLHESGEWIRAELALRPTKPDPQGVGSAITYGRRYLLLAMCGIAPEDDDGAAASAPAAAKSAPKNAQPSAPPASRAPAKEWTAALLALAKKLPREEVLIVLGEHAAGCGISDISEREVARDVYAALAKCAEKLGVPIGLPV